MLAIRSSQTKHNRIPDIRADLIFGQAEFTKHPFIVGGDVVDAGPPVPVGQPTRIQDSSQGQSQTIFFLSIYYNQHQKARKQSLRTLTWYEDR